MTYMVYLISVVVCYKEITTEVGNSMIGAESTVIDDTENNSPVTKPVIISSLSICILYNYYYRIFFDPDIDYKKRSNNGIILRQAWTNH